MKAMVHNQNNILVFEGFHKYLLKKKMPMINKNFKFIIKVIVFIILFLPYFCFFKFK